MRIGIISDSHGRHVMVRRALALFDGPAVGGVDLIVHCGDVCGEAVFGELAGRPCRFVWGNMDEPNGALRAFVESLDIPLPPDDGPLLIDAAGKRIAVMHGHETGFQRLPASGRFDYVLHGHTHQRRDERVGRCRVINPGALHRTNPRSAAVLDVAADVVTFHDIAV